jgi:hypothetical protein
VFFGIDRDVESSNLLWNLDMFLGRLPRKDFLPIACDPGGSLFCLVLSGDGNGMILYCDLMDPNGLPYRVAADFNALLRKLRAFSLHKSQ